MPFIPHTKTDIESMLATIGVKSIEELFDEIPASLRQVSLNAIPLGISEMELDRLMRKRASCDDNLLCFIGAGAYEHHIPAAVWELASRGEFYSAYTPYQAEASQGALQLIYEYQTMMASLMGMEVSNASLYDGASAFAESILMAIRLANKSEKLNVLVPKTVNPYYRETAKTIVGQQKINLIDVPYDLATGRTDLNALEKLISNEVAALVIPQPNFFGVIEEVDELANLAYKHQLISIALVNPVAMALLKPPGQWGEHGVDMVCGEGQPLGIPLASGGPYYGFFCCKKSHVRQMPGRVVGRTRDAEGKTGYVLTLQAREQHIRRAKATSNICTNQGLMVTASTIFMSLLGPLGLKRVALCSHQNTHQLKEALAGVKDAELVFSTPFFHEIVLRVNQPAKQVLAELAKKGIQGGFALDEKYPELENCLLICATETKTNEDIKWFVENLKEVLSSHSEKEGRKVACHPI